MGRSAEELAQRGALQEGTTGLDYGRLEQAGEEAALRYDVAGQQAAADLYRQRAQLGQGLVELGIRSG